jgi:pyrroloquinoline quinone biosynthesis protein D
MMLARERALISPHSRPKMRRHIRLQYDAIRSAWAVLAPEKVLWPDEPSLGILRLCDGAHSVVEISEQLAKEFDADITVIRDDVEIFLQTWSDHGLVNL